MKIAIYAVLIIVVGWLVISLMGSLTDVKDLKLDRQQKQEQAIKDATG